MSSEISFKKHCTKPWSSQYSEEIVVDIPGHLSTRYFVFDRLMLPHMAMFS